MKEIDRLVWHVENAMWWHGDCQVKEQMDRKVYTKGLNGVECVIWDQSYWNMGRLVERKVKEDYGRDR